MSITEAICGERERGKRADEGRTCCPQPRQVFLPQVGLAHQAGIHTKRALVVVQSEQRGDVLLRGVGRVALGAVSVGGT